MSKSFRKVYDSLFVSGYQGAKDNSEKFDRTVSLAAPTESTDKCFIISDGQHNYGKFESAVNKIIEYLKDDNLVLVNCQAGLSRSVSACISAQVCYYEIPFTEALQNARFGHRLPEPELLRSAERYISENYNYREERRLKHESKKALELFSEDLIDRIEEDDKIESEDQIKKHIKNVLLLKLDDIQKK